MQLCDLGGIDAVAVRVREEVEVLLSDRVPERIRGSVAVQVQSLLGPSDQLAYIRGLYGVSEN